MKVLKKVKLDFLLFQFIYLAVSTDENDIIKGFSLFFFSRRFTITLANTLWVDDQDKPIYIGRDREVFYFFKMAFSYKQIERS